MKKQFYLILIFLIVAQGLLAGGSSYSVSTYGNYEYKPNSRALGMGGISLAVPNAWSINIQNPAALIGIPMARFDLGMYIEGNNASTGGLKSSSSRATVNNVSFALPFGKNYAAAFTIARFTSVNYDFQVPDQAFEGFVYNENLFGQGGLQQVAFTFAGKIDPRWTLGISAQYMFGTINREWQVNWDGDDLVDTRDRLDQNIHGGRWSLGVLHRFDDRWNFGGYIAFSSDMKSDLRTIGTYRDTVSETSRSTDFPAEFGLGATYQFDKRYMAGVDLIYGTWGGVPSLFAAQKTNDVFRLSTGLERKPNTALNARWWDKNFYRAGMYFQNVYATNNSQKTAREIFLTLGLGIPFNRDKGMLDISFEAGQRGQIETNTIRDRVYRLTISVSTGERWFQNRQKRRKEQ